MLLYIYENKMEVINFAKMLILLAEENVNERKDRKMFECMK